MQMNSGLALAGFILAALAAASSGVVFRPGAWYLTLRKPGWTPRPWVFPVVWTPLYIAIALSGWLAWRETGLFVLPFAAYGVQLLLNAGWSAVFFGLHRPDLALGEIVLLWLSILATIVGFAPVSAAAAWLLVPYLAWVTVAALLNATVWRLNTDTLARV